jgi:hypothetical protein
MEAQITAGEIRLLSALVHCPIPAGTVDRRFVDLMCETARDSRTKLTAGQRGYIRRLAIRYRQQLPADLVETVVNPAKEAGKPAAPDPVEAAPAELDLVESARDEPGSSDPVLVEGVVPS